MTWTAKHPCPVEQITIAVACKRAWIHVDSHGFRLLFGVERTLCGNGIPNNGKNLPLPMNEPHYIGLYIGKIEVCGSLRRGLTFLGQISYPAIRKGNGFLKYLKNLSNEG